MPVSPEHQVRAPPLSIGFAYHTTAPMRFYPLVLQVLFDTEDTSNVGGRGSLFPPVLFCTSDGTICRASTQDQHAEGLYEAFEAPGLAKVEVITREGCSFNSFDVQRSGSSDIIAVTDYETLFYIQRGDVHV